MTSCRKKIVKVLFLFTLTVSCALSSFASELNNPINGNDSLYKYNALENKINFPNTIHNGIKLKAEKIENSMVKDENTKELRDAIEKQKKIVTKTESEIVIMKNQNGIETFFVGNNSGTLKFQMVQLNGQIYTLRDLLSKTEDEETISKINNQIDILDKQKNKVENFISEQDGKFSLFGWIINLL